MKKFDEMTLPNSCMGRAELHEMTFVLLARDCIAPAVIRFWCEQRIKAGKNSEFDSQIVEAIKCANEMERQLAAGEVGKR